MSGLGTSRRSSRVSNSPAGRTRRWVQEVAAANQSVEEEEDIEEEGEEEEDGEVILTRAVVHEAGTEGSWETVISHAPSRAGSSCSRVSSASARLRRAQDIAQAEREFAEKARERERLREERERLREEREREREKREQQRAEEELRRRRLLAELEEQAQEEAEEEERRSSASLQGSHEVKAQSARSLGSSKGANSCLANEIAEAFHRYSALPRPEMPTFNGDEAVYNRFIIAFDAAVGESSLDDRAKLAYLIQQCRGDARKCIEDCVLLGPELGYAKARELLEGSFGRPWIIAEQLLKELTEGPSLKANDNAALRKLSLCLSKCSMNVLHAGFAPHLDGPQTIRAVVRRLPYSLRNMWAELAYKKNSKGVAVTLSDLAAFVREREAVAASLYGQDVKQEEGRTGSISGSKKKDPPRRATTYAADSEAKMKVGTAAVAQEPCAACNRGCADLATCQEFPRLSLHDRRRIAFESGACFICLGRNHTARRCSSHAPCPVSNCKSYHHQLLHEWKTSTSSVPRLASQTATNMTINAQGGCARVLLGIVPVKVMGSDGRTFINTNALLDNGSSQSFCTEALLQCLGIKGKSEL